MRLSAMLTASLLLLTGCAPAQTNDPILRLEQGQDVLAQVLTWENCEDGFECAVVGAPLDWLAEDSDFIPISLIRKADSGDKPIIFVNPGGPGVSGVDWMRSGYETVGSTELRDQFQLIAFDPRGVGDSAGVTCPNQSIKDTVYYSQSPHPFGSEADIAYSREVMGAFAADCQKIGFDTAFFNTQQTARDLELLRIVSGSESLNYLGFSYGTLLGSTYAALFPDKVGKLVLDGAINPLMTESEMLLGQVAGFDSTFRAYLADCIEKVQCPFNKDVESAITLVAQFLEDRESSTLPTQLDRELSLQATLAGIIAALYSEESWVYLSQAFDEALDGDGTTFLLLADFYNNRELERGYTSNLNEANLAISCADNRIPESEAKALDPKFAQASAVFGKYFAQPHLACESWPEGKSRVDLDFGVKLANAPLVVGTTGDPATPYSQAVALSELLDGAVLLTLKADRHTAYGSNTCIDAIVEAYFRGEDIGTGDKTCN